MTLSNKYQADVAQLRAGLLRESVAVKCGTLLATCTIAMKKMSIYSAKVKDAPKTFIFGQFGTKNSRKARSVYKYMSTLSGFFVTN